MDGGTVNLPIFVHSALDDYGLTANEFRLAGHISRRGGNEGECYASIESMSAVCIMHPDTLRESLKRLISFNIISRRDRSGQTSIHKLNPIEQWNPPENNPPEKSRGVKSSGGSGRKRSGDYPPEKNQRQR